MSHSPLLPPRRKTREVPLGPFVIGGDNPVRVQSMTATETSDIEATVAQIRALREAGCEIVWSAADLGRPDDQWASPDGRAQFWATPRGNAVYAPANRSRGTGHLQHMKVRFVSGALRVFRMRFGGDLVKCDMGEYHRQA